MPNGHPFSRRQLLGGALLGVTGAQATEADKSSSAETFNGTVGRTAADSKPSPLKPEQAPKGSPNVIFIVLDDTGFRSPLLRFRNRHAQHRRVGGRRFALQLLPKQSRLLPFPAPLLAGRDGRAVGMKELAGPDLGYPNARGRVTPSAATIAQILQSNGYSPTESANGIWFPSATCLPRRPDPTGP